MLLISIIFEWRVSILFELTEDCDCPKEVINPFRETKYLSFKKQ